MRPPQSDLIQVALKDFSGVMSDCPENLNCIEEGITLIITDVKSIRHITIWSQVYHSSINRLH